MNFSAEIPNSRITATVTEFPDLVIANSSTTTTGTYTDQAFSHLLQKNHDFYAQWTHDPRPMVVRAEIENRPTRTRLVTVVIEFTSGQSVMFAPNSPGDHYWEPCWDAPLTETTGRRAVVVANTMLRLAKTLGRTSDTVGKVEKFIRDSQQGAN